MGFVYGLLDPRTRALRYVGKTIKTPEERLQGHLSETRASRKCLWIRDLRDAQLRPEIVVLCECSIDDIDVEEVAMIAAMRATGANLLNVAHGNCAAAGCSAAGGIVGAQANRARQKTDPPEADDFPLEEEFDPSQIDPELLKEFPQLAIWEMTDEQAQYHAERELAEIERLSRNKRIFRRRSQQRLLQQYRSRCGE